MKRKNSYNVVSLILILTIAVNMLALFPIEPSQAQGPTMTFTTGETININSNDYIDFWSNVSMTFTSGIQVQFIELINGNGILEYCDVIQVVFPPGFVMEPCSWWEVLDPLGNPTGFEFHIDQQYGPSEFHVDMVWPGPFPLPVPGGINFAEKKISVIEPCQYYVVHWPSGWYPAPCSWWEIIDPETGHPTGYEFHVDWTNESCEFHIDEVIPGPYMLPFPWHEIEARGKITEIFPCDWYTILTGGVPTSCSWWEIMYQGQPTGLEFHVDESIPASLLFHVDIVSPDPLKIPPTYPTTARRKISTIEPCTWLKVDDLTSTPQPCTWWKITNPAIGDYEFHVDESNQDGTFHVDLVYPSMIPITPAADTVIAEKKITTIQSCDWFKVITGWLPQPCSWWTITSPAEWAGVIFHVDSTDGISKFHIDQADTLPLGPTPPPWSVTAEEYTPPEPWYIKPPYPDYVPSGMPDFDQKQDQWGPGVGIYTWCGPVSVANSLWWLDSEYESLNFPQAVPPPIISDHFLLVTSYNPGVWDDHDPQNVDPLVRNLAFLMDTDGQRTGLTHQGTNYIDMETGISQYLQQQGVNPIGDCDGDGKVEPDDITIINNAMGSIPGAPNWNMTADVIINNLIDINDLAAANSHLGQTGMFYEHTEEFADFYWIEAEIERCQDVELFLEFWQWTGSSWVKLYQDPSLEAGHFVTCAGVNSTNRELLISDPYWDTFEAGATQGRSPVAHPYPHQSSVHNDTRYVSHDEYTASLWMVPPPSPYGSKPVWELAGYLQAHGYDQTWHAFIRAAVATSPLGVHDIAVTNVTTSKDGCKPMPTVGKAGPKENPITMRINVTVKNEGDFTESFTLTVNVTNSTTSIVVGTQAVNNLPIGETWMLTFIWDTTSAAYGDYTISAYATPIPQGESNTANNLFTDGVVRVVIPGDVNGDGIVDVFDAVLLSGAAGADPTWPNWNPNADINDDEIIDVFDAVILSGHAGNQIP